MTTEQRHLLTRAASLEVQIQRAASRGDVVAVRSLENDLAALWREWARLQEGEEQ